MSLNTLHAGPIVLQADTASGELLLRRPDSERLIAISEDALFVPIIDGQKHKATFEKATFDGTTIVQEWTFPAEAGITGFAVHIARNEKHDCLDIWSEFVLERDAQLNAIALLPEDSLLNLYEVVNFRNRHRTDRTWPELLLGAEAKTSTYSDDWQFAPHPSALLFRKNDLSLFLGALDVQATFGVRLHARDFRVKTFDLDYGSHPHGLPLAAGTHFSSTRMRLLPGVDAGVYDAYAHFGQTLIADGLIADPEKKERFAWWREPIYCTWTDQCLLSQVEIPLELQNQTPDASAAAAATLNEDMIRRAVRVIKAERLPIRTIILDEGWAMARGDWEAHPARFPNLRALVDELHAEGFKVMVWWNWAEIGQTARVETRHLFGGGARNKHGAIMRDYSHPATQAEYFQPLFRKLFSSEPGCYNLDGVKTDFLADKIHSETPVHDPSWRGEERYFIEMTRLFYTEMRKYKADALHLAGAGNYWLAEHIDLNRTYDVHSSNWREHEERGLMLAATTPGAPVSYDMMVVTENTPRWFESARRNGASVEIGNVLTMQDDVASKPRPADEGYLAMLRENLSLCVKS